MSTETRSRQRDPVADLPNPNAGRYLREILVAVGGPDEEVRPSTVATRLGVTPASVTEMTGRLAAAELVDHEPYGGISLTERGASLARHLQWRQCVLRRFFEEAMEVEVSPAASFEASVALPIAALRALREALDLDCRDRCDDRVFTADCGAPPRPTAERPEAANSATSMPHAPIDEPIESGEALPDSRSVGLNGE